MGSGAGGQPSQRLYRRWACVLHRHVSGRMWWLSARSSLWWHQWRAHPLPMRVQTEPPCLLIATDGCCTLLASLHGLCATLAGSVEAVQAMSMRSAAACERMPSARSSLRWPRRRAHPLPMRVQIELPCLPIATDGCASVLACHRGLCGRLAARVDAVQAMSMRSAAAREQ